ncbi:MAG: bifunctional serine/threonine-protein kinase/formylglycine-generating enzyme family protein [Planctomycetota bacterium]
MRTEEMESDPDERERRLRAEALYQELEERLAEQSQSRSGSPSGSVDNAEFDALVSSHPELRDELRALREDMAALDRVRRGALAVDSFSAPSVVALMNRLVRGGTLRDRFDMGAEIGRGGQGTVTEATELGLQRAVAIKRPGRASDAVPGGHEESVSRFLAEAQITAQLDHPGIVAVHELGLDEDGQPYFSMARVSGRSLAEFFGAEPLVRSVGVLARVADAVAFAHSRGVIHRDLKPANVMVGAFGEVYVMDWGLALAADAAEVTSVRVAEADPREPANRTVPVADPLSTDPRGRLGTLPYLAPEMLAAEPPRASAAVDVYAIGAMLYEALVGHPPHADVERSLEESVQRRLQATPRRPREINPSAPRELEAIALKATARAREARYASVELLGSDLRAYLEGRVVEAHGVGPWASFRKWVGRHPALAALIAVTAFGLLGFALRERRARADLDRSADLYRLPFLEEVAQDLWPEAPELLPAFDRWLRDAERLASRAHLQRRALESLRRRKERGGLDDLEQLRLGTLEANEARLAAFTAEPDGLLADVRSRRRWAATVRERTVAAYAREWAEAGAATAADARLGFSLEPVSGLVPLGADASTGLQEFAFLRSGAVPGRDREGKLRIDGDSAIVFVLVPGGVSWLGAQREDPEGRGFDPLARAEESPIQEVALASFWVSKFEMTAGQWKRLGGGDPSLVDEPESDDPLRHPVEGVSRDEASKLLERFGLELPTEAQWAYAARAGTAGSTLGFEDAKSLAGYVNLADATVLDAGLGWPQARGMDWLRDGYLRHAPVGSFLPNAFGLHDVVGNVWEWCRDAPGDYAAEYEEGSGLRRTAGTAGALARGGGFINNAAFARIAIRDMGRSSSFDSSYHGVRPVLARRAR